MQDGSSKDRFYLLKSIYCRQSDKAIGYGNLVSEDKHTTSKHKQEQTSSLL